MGLADVDDERQGEGTGQGDRPCKGRGLCRTRRVIVVEVQARLAEADHARRDREAGKGGEGVVVGGGGVVRMDTDRRHDPDRRGACGEGEGGSVLRDRAGGPDAHEQVDAIRRRALEHRVAVGVELGLGDVAM